MKKLLLTEVLLACLFLVLILGVVGEVSVWKETALETGSELYQKETRKSGTIWVYPGEMNDSFSPLQYQTFGEKNVISMCFSNLLTRDKNGKRKNQEVSTSWGREQFAHISFQCDTSKELCKIEIELNPNAKTVSGREVNVKDIIFNYYLRADSSSMFSNPFGGVEIVGQKEYTYGTTNIATREKEVQALLKKPTSAFLKQCSKEIIQKELEQELEWVKSLYDNEAYTKICSKYEKPKDLFAYYFSYQTKYSSKGKEEAQVLKEIVKQYKGDYKKLSKLTQRDYTNKAKKIALSVILSQKGKDTIKNISGIKEKDSHTVEIVAKGSEECVDKVCNLWILPLSEYGDNKKYDGKTSFGFTKGEADKVVESTRKKYLGTGPYYLKERQDEKLIFQKNANFFGENAKIDEVQIWKKEYSEYEEIVRELLEQKIDLVFAKDDVKLDELLQNRGTRANTRIQKETFSTNQKENCFLYRTSYINTPSIPKEISEFCSFFEQISILQVNEKNQTNSPEE